MADSSLRDKQSALLFNVLQSVAVLMFLLFSVVFSNSIIALADLIQEGSDMIAMLFSYIAIRKISESRNQTYNYGYGKLEAFASLLIAAVMVMALIFVLFNLARAFSNPVVLEGVGVYTAIGTNVVDGAYSFFVWQRMRSLSKDGFSPIIDGQLHLFRAGFLASVMIASSLTLGLWFSEYTWGRLIDPIGGLVLALVLVYSILKVFPASIDNLMDKTLEEGLQIAILRALANNVDRMDEFYEVSSRRSGSDVYVEVFIGFAPDACMTEVLDNAAILHQSIRNEIGGGSITIVPTNTEMMRLRNQK
jgi:cation diffusion facilitator family transporter